MGRILYKDIELDEANKEVHFAHSRFVGRDINTDWMDSLRSIDKNSLSHAQFGDISRLNSVANLDYQVCNGGVAQYFDNGYDCYREPYNEQDVAHFGKSEQVSQLQALARFGESVFPEKALENSNIRHIADALNALDDSDETSRCDLAFEARDMRDGKDAFASTEQENVQGLRDCNR